VPLQTTGKLILWSFLSRGVSPYVQEAMFLDAVRGIEPFVRASAAGTVTLGIFFAYRGKERVRPTCRRLLFFGLLS
jgi:hypothetical protein